MKGFLKGAGLLLLAVILFAVLRVVRGESDPEPVESQAEIYAAHGVPVEATPVVREPVQREVRAYGTARGASQVEIFVPSPNFLERLHVAVGDPVRRGQRLASMRPVALSPLGYPYGPLQAKHEATQADLARYEALYADDAITGQQIDHARAAARAAAADWDAARSAVHLTSPIAGTVTRIDFRPGEMVPNDRPLLQVATLDDVVVDLMLEPVDVGLVEVGHPVELRSSAIPGVLLHGEVVEVALAAHPLLGQYRTRVRIDAEAQVLPGYPFEATLAVGPAEPVLAVPEASLVRRDRGDGVWLATDTGARYVPVQVSLRGGGRAAVSGDLAPGDLVVTLGQADLLHDGQAVRVIE